MGTLRDDLWGAWHLKENRSRVLQRLEQITRLEKKRQSASERVLKFRDAKSHEKNRAMLRHWAQKIDDCAYESLGIANGLLGKRMP